MSAAAVENVARALMYEGYALYPYRPSVKSRHRWTFGGVYPPAWSRQQEGTDLASIQLQCLLEADSPSVRATIRFLHLFERATSNAQPWQDVIERQIDLYPGSLAFSFAADPALRQEAIEGTITYSTQAIADGLFRITLQIGNTTALAGGASRDDALLRTFVSTHAILTATNGQFVSLTDPPEPLKSHAAACKNIGLWPVLVGAPGERSTMLASPIIVGDYPQIAPQSNGDLFDSTEIDEILTLRILTLTDEEKRSGAETDGRVGDLLARTQALARENLARLHGAMKPAARDCDFKPGDAVRLRPLGRGDVMDLALDGKAATVVSVERDFEDRVYVSVTVDDDPGKDLGAAGQPGHRFFFGVDEVEPIAEARP